MSLTLDDSRPFSSKLRGLHHGIFTITYFSLPGRTSIFYPADKINDDLYRAYGKKFNNQELLQDLIKAIETVYGKGSYDPLSSLTRIEVGLSIVKQSTKNTNKKGLDKNNLDERVKESIANMKRVLSDTSIHEEDLSIIENSLREYRITSSIAAGTGSFLVGIIVLYIISGLSEPINKPKDQELN